MRQVFIHEEIIEASNDSITYNYYRILILFTI